jgi:hypothetical protein
MRQLENDQLKLYQLVVAHGFLHMYDICTF